MRRLFWPLLTTIIFFSVMVLWFCLGAMTTQLTHQVEDLLIDEAWASYDLTGRKLVIRGIAPDENVENNILNLARAIPGIASVSDEVITTPLKKPFQLILEKNINTIIIKGYFPVTLDRFEFFDTLDSIVVDQAENARGANEHFSDWLDYALEQINQLQSGTIILEDNIISIDAVATSKAVKENITNRPLPTGLLIKKMTITVK